MVHILDQHLDILLCSQCQKYLSKLPIKVYKDGKIKCGRCCEKNDGGVESLYQELARKCLFKCVNRYEGCNKLLHPSEVAVHEEICTGSTYSCPKCKVSRQLSILQLIEHFKQNHRNNFLSSNIFYINLNENLKKEQYLYIQNENIFLILLQFIPNDKYLFISAVTLKTLKNITQQYILSVDSLQVKRITTSENCLSLDKFKDDKYFKIDISNIINRIVKIEIILDTTTTSIRCNELQSFSKSTATLETKDCQTGLEPSRYSIQMSRKFQTKYPEYSLTFSGTALYSNKRQNQIQLTCSNCEQLITIGMICASKKHSVCLECMAWCGLCQTHTISINYTLKSICKLLSFPCKWKCGKHLNATALKQHEMGCRWNIRKCPICRRFMTLKVLKTHLKSVHQSEFVEIISLQEFFYDQLESGDNRYFIINENMFKIKWNFNNDQVDLQVTPCDKMNGLELFVVTKNGCHELESWRISVILKDIPYFYLRQYK